jgi:hypothetical protein
MWIDLVSSVQLAIGLILVAAAVLKVLSWRTFVESLAPLIRVSKSTAAFFGSFFIFYEALLGSAHLLGLALTIALPLTALLFAVFSIANGFAVATGAKAKCMCFGGPSGEPIGSQSLIRAISLLAAECVVLLSPEGTYLLKDFSRLEYKLAISCIASAIGLMVVGAWLTRAPVVWKVLRHSSFARQGATAN